MAESSPLPTGPVRAGNKPSPGSNIFTREKRIREAILVRADNKGFQDLSRLPPVGPPIQR